MRGASEGFGGVCIFVQSVSQSLGYLGLLASTEEHVLFLWLGEVHGVKPLHLHIVTRRQAAFPLVLKSAFFYHSRDAASCTFGRRDRARRSTLYIATESDAGGQNNNSHYCVDSSILK